MGSYSTVITALILLLSLCSSHAARILGIFPTPSISHQLPFQIIMKTLASRGHQVTIISPNPLKSPPENYTDIDLSASYQFTKEWDFHTWSKISPVESLSIFNELFTKVLEFQLESPQIQSLMKDNDTTFDLVLLERLCYQAYFGLIHHFGSPPVVGILSLGGTVVSHNSMGNPTNPAYIPDVLTPFSNHMTFWQRACNTFANLMTTYKWRTEILPPQEVLLRKYFGSAPPSVYETEYNDSLLILNNHWSLNYPRPLLPNVLEVTGLHVQISPKPLPTELQKFLDGAEHGVIYFSLGSNVKSKFLPEEKVKQILEAFSEVPQRVLWKWELDALPGKPSNVLVGKWLPQQDVLAHPNVRLFITQGGLQSFQEAAYHGVPLIGIPFIGDQFHDVAKFEAAKIGVKLEFEYLNKDSLLDALGKVLNDSSYRENMKTFSAVYREEVEPSLKRAIWGIEYVLRHKGARHLRSAALDLTWYQYLLLDVIAVFFLGLAALSLISYIVFRKLIYFAMNYTPSSKLKET